MPTTEIEVTLTRKQSKALAKEILMEHLEALTPGSTFKYPSLWKVLGAKVIISNHAMTEIVAEFEAEKVIEHATVKTLRIPVPAKQGVFNFSDPALTEDAKEELTEELNVLREAIERIAQRFL